MTLPQYPAFYTFKATGAAGPLFRARIVQHVETALGVKVEESQVQVRASSGGKYESLSVHVYLRSEDERRRVYQAFHADKDILWYV